MTTQETYYNYISYLNEMISKLQGIPSEAKRLEEIKLNILNPHSLMLPEPFVLKWDWSMERNKIINMDRNMVMHPFDVVEFMSGMSKSVEDSFRCLDLFQKFMHQFIDRKCR